MAEHPHGYGQYLGHYPPASYSQISSPSTSQMPYTAAPQVAAMPPTNYLTSQSAYDYNSNRIPGLGLGDAPITSTSFPPTAPQMWSFPGQTSQINGPFQKQHQTPTSTLKQPPIPYQQSNHTLEEGELSEGEFEDLYDPKHLTLVSRAAPPAQTSRPSNSSDIRNGSVGDADESSIYDPQDESVVRITPNTLPNAPEQEYTHDDEWEPSYQDRERSGSYSPYLSPREVHRKISIAKVTPRDNKGADQVGSFQPPHQPGVKIHTPSNVVPHSNGITLAPSDPKSNIRPASTSKGESQANIAPAAVQSTLEAKKKAQEAILGLWPLKVRYQDYIEEGLKADIVKALFKDLGLDVPASKQTTAPTGATSGSRTITGKEVASSNVSPQPPSRSVDTTQAPVLDSNQSGKRDNKENIEGVKAAQKSAAEERKDKIARKLAAMAQKTTAAQPSGPTASVSAPVSLRTPTPKLVPVSVPSPVSVPVSVPSPVSVPVSAPSPASVPVSAPSPASVPVSAPSPASVPIPVPSPAPTPVAAATEATILGTKSITSASSVAPKTKAENNAILQRKLAALKKQQAQLAAEKALAASKESTTPSSPAAGDPHAPDISRNSRSTPKVISAATQHVSSEQPSSAELQDISKDENIPGLSFSSLATPQPAQGSNRSLKRPVASDFDSYTPRFETLKRSRTHERLVIDVSDDEDVEMDMGSPTDERAPSVDSSAAPRQSLSAFPPLSDGPNWGQRLSPASSSAPTPPVHGARIDLLHKRIEETKRLIAEAEAKKAAKKAISPQSPKPSSPAAQQPVELLPVHEGTAGNKRIIANRRDRIVSYELPSITAALKEKQEKLKIILAEAAQLELEVQASLDEQQKLTAEIECLVESSSANSPQPDEQASQCADPITNSPHLGPATAYNSGQDAREEHLNEQRSTQDRESPPTCVDDVETDLNNDEALQAAILTDNTHTIDVPMADADVLTPDDDDEAPTGSVSPSSLQAGHQAQPTTKAVERITQRAIEGIPVDTVAVANDSIAGLDPRAATTLASEPDVGPSDSDVSMQQSVAELSQSDDESYEPAPVQISDSRGMQRDARKSTEVTNYPPIPNGYSLTKRQVDAVLEEPNPNHILAEQKSQGQEKTSDEVKYRSTEEPLVLTTSQDDHDNRPPPEDLLSYKSPLSYFRAYKFHPKFFEEVPGGLKSLTFSARIDPMRELCPQVLAGEPCPKGASCEYQHFDSMILPDGEIITQLGSADMFAGETRTKFITGLKMVLNDLKAKRVKDFESITKAIIKHRQEFLGDKTKVLALDCKPT